MHYLALAILCSVIVSVLLKVARKQNIVLEQAIALNYVMAFSLNYLWFKPSLPSDLSTLPWGIFLALGVLLPTVFIIMGKAVEYAGIAKSDVAQRLSLILPIVAAVLIFAEQIVAYKMLGVGLAFIALFCLLTRSDSNNNGLAKGGSLAGFALIGVFLGYGVIDILFKQLSKSGSALPVSLAISFAMGFVLMLSYICVQKQSWTAKSIMGGLLLGIFNFFNILFYIKAHQHFKESPTLVFTAMNIGVIVLGTLTGTAIFREKLKAINFIGLVLAIVAIVILFYGQYL